MIAMVALAGKAQTASSNIDVELVAGVNSTNISYGTLVSRTGFHAGVRLSKDLKFFTDQNAIYGNVGALLSLKGGTEKTDEGDYTYNPYYLEVPVHVGYSYQANPNYKFYFEMGPYVAVGLFGKTEGASVFGDLDFRQVCAPACKSISTIRSRWATMWASSMCKRAPEPTRISTFRLPINSKSSAVKHPPIPQPSPAMALQIREGVAH